MDNCGLYIAKVVGTSSSDDSRLQVRVLPCMEDLEETDCPKWPFFFKDELYTGKKNELVWCICDDHFNVGFILGPANYYANYSSNYDTYTQNKGSSRAKTITLSPPQEALLDVIWNNASKVGATELGSVNTSKNFNMNNMKVTYWTSTCIHFVDRTTGSFVIAYNTGTILKIHPEEFFCYVAEKTDNSNSFDPSKGSTLKINSSGISLKSSSIFLQADQVNLGKNPKGNILVTEGSTSEGGRPSEYAKA